MSSQRLEFQNQVVFFRIPFTVEPLYNEFLNNNEVPALHTATAPAVQVAVKT